MLKLTIILHVQILKIKSQHTTGRANYNKASGNVREDGANQLTQCKVNPDSTHGEIKELSIGKPICCVIEQWRYFAHYLITPEMKRHLALTDPFIASHSIFERGEPHTTGVVSTLKCPQNWAFMSGIFTIYNMVVETPVPVRSPKLSNVEPG